MYRQGHFFRYANPSQWILRWQGRYGFDARQGILRQGSARSRVVALTFDDGPHETSPELLDILKRYGAHATFFLVGSNVVRHPDYVKRMLAEGNDVGNHTRTHLRLPGLRADQIRAELENDTIVIERAATYRVRLFRPPGGQFDDRVTGEAAREGMLTVLWSNNTGDWQAKDSRWIVNRVLSDVRPGDIILLHEDYPQTLAAMPDILEGLQARGFRAVTVSELIRESGIHLPALRARVPLAGHSALR
jgi:peptidoglycan/xylan/chitin deacetylase (PgdA/CDA1 family)